MAKFKYYDIHKILEEYPNAYYYLIIGERSNGKTYSALQYALERYFKYGEQFAYVRRWGEDIRKSKLTELFSGHIKNGLIEEYSKGDWMGVDYGGSKFRLVKADEDGKAIYSEDTIGFAFDLNSMEHYKSISFPQITTIIFDEFLARQSYLPNEFMLFTNSVSTIVRLRTDVKIFMLGNTVNKYCPYFSEMGLKHIKDQKQGTIDLYRYGDTGLEVVVEYCEASANRGGKGSDVYFAFDNPQLQMITQGSWEIAIYPHLPEPYKPKEVVCQFFIDFDHELLHGNLISKSGYAPFIFLHRKTTEVKKDTDIVYGQRPDASPYHRIGFRAYKDKLTSFIRRCYAENRIFYSENEVGEIFRNYLLWADNENIKRK